MATLIKTLASFKNTLSAKAVESIFDSEEFTIKAGILEQAGAEYDATKGRYRIDMGENKFLTILAKVEIPEDSDFHLLVLTFKEDQTNYKGKQGLNFKAGSSFLIATIK